VRADDTLRAFLELEVAIRLNETFSLLPRIAITDHRNQINATMSSAGNGNRTRMASLEGWNFTIKLCPRDYV
jgi:hypothetical protein